MGCAGEGGGAFATPEESASLRAMADKYILVARAHAGKT